MLSEEQILQYLGILSEELARSGVKGELCLHGGSVMCLAYDSRRATRDVHAVFVAEQIKPATQYFIEELFQR